MQYCIGFHINIQFLKTFINIISNGPALIQCGGCGNLENTISTFNAVKDSGQSFKP